MCTPEVTEYMHNLYLQTYMRFQYLYGCTKIYYADYRQRYIDSYFNNTNTNTGDVVNAHQKKRPVMKMPVIRQSCGNSSN